MLYVIGLLATAFLIALGVSLRTGRRSRRRSDNLLASLFSGASAVGLVSVWIAVVTLVIPEILASGLGLLVTVGVAIAAPAATTWITRGWLRR